jgi:signal peptidase II
MNDPQDGRPEQLGPSAGAAPEALAPEAPRSFPEPAPLPADLMASPPAESLAPSSSLVPAGDRPTFRFFGIVAAVSLVLDVSTKSWAEIRLYPRGAGPESIELIKDHLGFTLAYNPGGAWGLFQHHSEFIRRPFFLLVSLLAIAFIINLYGRLTPQQRALKWGLPLVLGGALGNLSDRIVRSNVIDFIDYQAKWIEEMNRLIAKVVKGWTITDHWPTFNVADIAICVGVGLMAVDMFTSRRGASASLPPRPPAGEPRPVAPAVVPAPEPLKPDA